MEQAFLVLVWRLFLFAIQFWYYRGRISIRTVNPIIYFTHFRGVCSCLANVVVNAKTFFFVLFFDSWVFVSCKIYDVFIISQNISFVISAKFWQMCKPLRNWCQMRQNFSRSSVLCLSQSTKEFISRVIWYCSKSLCNFGGLGYFCK